MMYNEYWVDFSTLLLGSTKFESKLHIWTAKFWFDKRAQNFSQNWRLPTTDHGT